MTSTGCVLDYLAGGTDPPKEAHVEKVVSGTTLRRIGGAISGLDRWTREGVGGAVREAREALCEAEIAISVRDREIAELRKQIGQPSDTASRDAARWAGQRDRIASLKRLIDKLLANIGRLESECRDKDATIAQLREQIAARGDDSTSSAEEARHAERKTIGDWFFSMANDNVSKDPGFGVFCAIVGETIHKGEIP